MYSTIRILDLSKINTIELIDLSTVKYVHRTVKKLLAKLGHSHLDHEDIAQEVLIALYKQEHRYNPEKAEKRTFIYHILHNKVLDVIRFTKTKRQNIRRGVKSLNERVYDEKGKAVELGKLLVDDRSADGNIVSQSFNESLNKLPAHLRTVCKLLSESSGRNLHRELGLSRHAFYKMMKELREEIQAKKLF
jgi:RNA polymerase sigma factor (sigma-70 family)